MLSLLFLTQYFFYIPKAALAAIIIAAVIFMVEVRVVIPMWKTKSEYMPAKCTRSETGHKLEKSQNSD
jgi:sodium-independent sulfate anion transporter 11